MAQCTISGSYPIDCARVAGGVAEIKVKIKPTDTSTSGGYTTSSGSVTLSSPATTGWYTFGVELETASANSDPQVNRQNGSAFYQQMVKVILNKLRASVNNELLALSQSQLQIAVKTQEGTCLLLGKDNGISLANSVSGTGTAMGDRNGYELNFEGKETSPAWVISNSWTALTT